MGQRVRLPSGAAKPGRRKEDKTLHSAEKIEAGGTLKGPETNVGCLETANAPYVGHTTVGGILGVNCRGTLRQEGGGCFQKTPEENKQSHRGSKRLKNSS